MTEQRLDLILARLDVTVEPDPAFAERLEADLLSRVGRARRFDRSLAGRVARAIDAIRVPTGVLPVPEAWQRVAGLAVLAVLLLVVALIATFVATRPPDPLSIIDRSAAVYQEPPAFDMTIVYDDGSVRRVRTDGLGRARVDAIVGSFGWQAEGSYSVADVSSRLVLEWSAAHGIGLLVDVPDSPALHRMDLAWGSRWSRETTLEPPNCDRWEVVGRDTIVGRPADHVRCAILLDKTQGPDYWVDQATGLLLRSDSVPASEDGAWMRGEVTTLDLAPVFEPGLFEIDTADPRYGYWLDGGTSALQPGRRYVSDFSSPRFSLVAPAGDWATWWASPQMIGFSRPPGSGPETQVFVTDLEQTTDPVTFEDVALGPGPEAILAWIEGHPRIVAEPRRTATVGGLPATALDFRFVLSDEFRALCPIDDDVTEGEVMPPCQRWFPMDASYFGVAFEPDDRLRVYALELASRTATVLVVQAAGAGLIDEPALADLLGAIDWLE